MARGIYIIENKSNGKIYIGSSINLRSRWIKHLSDLRRGTHSNPHLQSAWTKYGEEAFEYRILETLEESVREREQHYINHYNALDRTIGYNIALTTTCPMEGRTHTPEAIEKMRQAKLGENNNFYGRTHTEETKAKLRKTMTGRKLSPEHKAKVVAAIRGAGADNTNAVLNDEIVLALRKEYLSLENTKGWVAKKSRELGVNYSTISRIVKNETWKHLL